MRFADTLGLTQVAGLPNAVQWSEVRGTQGCLGARPVLQLALLCGGARARPEQAAGGARFGAPGVVKQGSRRLAAQEGVLAVAAGNSVQLLHPGDLAGPRAFASFPAESGDAAALEAPGGPRNVADVHYAVGGSGISGGGARGGCWRRSAALGWGWQAGSLPTLPLPLQHTSKQYCWQQRGGRARPGCVLRADWSVSGRCPAAPRRSSPTCGALR